MLAMRLAVCSFLSSVWLAVLRTRQSISTHASHWLPPSSTAAPWATCCGRASFEKRRPGRSLTGCKVDADDDDNDDNDEEEELKVQVRNVVINM
jgi:hypothetical protein